MAAARLIQARRRLPATAARGFTLLETLIASVLIVLVVSLLMTALAQTARIQSRVAELRAQRTGFDLGVSWWRELAAGLQPAGPADPSAFRGGGRSFSGVSIAPPTAQSPGRAVAFSLAVDTPPGGDEAVLRYASGSRQVDLLRLPADEVRFAYLAADGEVFDAWPPNRADPPELPAAIRMTVIHRGQQRALFAAIGGPARAMPTAQGLFAPAAEGATAPR
jgi:hypothetical protein